MFLAIPEPSVQPANLDFWNDECVTTHPPSLLNLSEMYIRGCCDPTSCTDLSAEDAVSLDTLWRLRWRRQQSVQATSKIGDIK